MKINDLKKRLRKDRPYSVITLRMPDDVIEDLEHVASKLDIPGYQALVCHYVGKGLREDLERLESTPVKELIKSLKRHGVSEEIISEAVADMTQV
jgi:hypothetical protein